MKEFSPSGEMSKGQRGADKDIIMEKDKELEELFLAQNTHFDDGADFMAALTKRLDAVEYLKQHQEATIRRYKMAMVVAFVVGIISGGISIGYLLTAPADEPLFSFELHNAVLVWLAENSRMIAATALALLMSFGVISIFRNVQDILHMKARMSHQPVFGVK